MRAQDPHLARERAKYSDPLPSREFILSLIEQAGVPVEATELEQRLDILAEEHEPFTRRLAAMERDGQLMRNRRNALCLPSKMDLLKARVEGHPEGFGFAVPEDGSADLFLGPREMQKTLHGDTVLVRVGGLDRRGRREGYVAEVLVRANTRLVGRLHSEHGVLYVVAENRRISQDILVAPGQDGGAQPGQVVMVELLTQPSRHAEPIARVAEIVGNYADPGMEVEIALRKHALPHEFPAAALTQAARLPSKVTRRDLTGRVDVRSLPLVTIDGETARDFDDAVYCAAEGRGFRLMVAIADVSHYVKPGDALDGEALSRGNSVYFPRRVIPMLPEELSNGLCSLNPAVDRLCMVCEMTVSAAGDISRYRFYPAVMHSQARLTYKEVAEILARPAAASPERQVLVPHLRMLEKVYRAFFKARSERGAIDFATVETQMMFDQLGKIERVVPVERNDAHRLIEECMLAANVCASDFLAAHKHPTLYRIHPGPTPEKLDAVRQFLGEVGLHLGGGEEPRARDYAELIDKIQGRPDRDLLQTVLLRSLQQARYSPDNVGHFGLAYDAYAHFTSPIRRYPDLLVHRAIRAVLAGESYNPGSWSEIALHCSTTERRADEATRDVEQWLKCWFMRDRINDEFEGTVSAVVHFGLFVTLDDVHVEGLIHISELGQDYYHHDPARHQLLGERSGKRWRLGDRIRIRVVRVDLETTRIDFVPAVAPASGASMPAVPRIDAPASAVRAPRSAPKVAAVAGEVVPAAAKRPSRARGAAKDGSAAETDAAVQPAPAARAKRAAQTALPGLEPAAAAPKRSRKAAVPAADAAGVDASAPAVGEEAAPAKRKRAPRRKPGGGDNGQA
ncbi:MAG: ribonuclease R [Pseudomonadota bacterium]|nr:ribonuclease R [Pseudomonadota bacterium]